MADLSFEELVQQGLSTAERVFKTTDDNGKWGPVQVSDPVVGHSPDGLAEVTITDRKVTRVRLDHMWFADAELEAVEQHILVAINDGLEQFFMKELETQRKLASNGPSLKELQDLSAQITQSFDRFADDIMNRVQR